MIEEIVFIYNAKSGLFNAFLDFSHKIISPKTYECKLCAITYNNLGKEKKWKAYLKSLDFKKTFYYTDNLSSINYINADTKMPCIFLKRKNKYQLIIDSNELNTFKNVDVLIDRISDIIDSNE